MAEQQENNEERTPNGAGGYIKFTAMGFQMIAVIGVFAYVGYRIDDSAKHNTHWVTAILALIGVFISLYLVIRAVKE